MNLNVLALPWVALALAGVIFLVTVTYPDPTRLRRLPRWVTTITLLRLLADLVVSAVLMREEAIFEPSGKVSPLVWIPISGVVLLQLLMVMLGWDQSTYVSSIHTRFMLDALPGQRMAVDADLHFGYLTAQEAFKECRDLAELQAFFDSLRRSVFFARLDVWISCLLRLVTGWQAWLMFAHGQQSALDLILVHNLLTTVTCLWLNEALATTAWRAANSTGLVSEPWLVTTGRKLRPVWILVLALLLLVVVLLPLRASFLLLVIVGMNLLLPTRIFRWHPKAFSAYGPADPQAWAELHGVRPPETER